MVLQVYHMEMNFVTIKPVIVDVNNVKPLEFGDTYESRMILDHVITGRDNVIQMNHGTVKKGKALEGSFHEEDEIYYILSGKAKLTLEDKTFDIYEGQVIFIPKGCFHAIDNTASDKDLKILTLWRDYRYNGAYHERIKLWGKSFKTVEEE